MPKPKSKTELLESGQINFKTLMELVNSYSVEEVETDFPKGTLNRNIRDVLTHLHQWHLFILDWYAVGMKGEKPQYACRGIYLAKTPCFE